MAAVGLGEFLAVAPADEEGRDAVGVEREEAGNEDEEVGGALCQIDNEQGKDEAEQHAADIAHEHSRGRKVERQEAEAGGGDRRSQQHDGGVAAGCRKTGEQAEADHPSDAGNAVDAVHEVVEVGAADHKDGRQGEKPEGVVKRAQGLKGDGGGEELAGEAHPRRQVEAVVEQAQQGDEGAGTEKPDGDFQPQSQADECQQDADAAAAGDGAGVGTALTGAVDEAEVVGSGGHEPGATSATEEN